MSMVEFVSTLPAPSSAGANRYVDMSGGMRLTQLTVGILLLFCITIIYELGIGNTPWESMCHASAHAVLSVRLHVFKYDSV